MRIFYAIIVAGLVTGTLDILSAFAGYVPHGATVTGILKFIASGLIGPGALKGGDAIAVLGLATHYALATAMAATYVGAALKAPMILSRPWVYGIVYGVLTYIAMAFIIVPHSGVSGWKLPHGWDIVSGLLAHCLFVGTPIAHFARFYLTSDTGPKAAA